MQKQIQVQIQGLITSFDPIFYTIFGYLNSEKGLTDFEKMLYEQLQDRTEIMGPSAKIPGTNYLWVVFEHIIPVFALFNGQSNQSSNVNFWFHT